MSSTADGLENIFVADTNLFFECVSLEDIQWEDLGCDPIVVALTKPVQNEIDRHKKGTGRTRKRALATFQRVRQMLKEKKSEVIIKESAPKVIFRLAQMALPDDELKGSLDYSQNDDRIVGVVSTLAKALHPNPVKLLTDDSGPAATSASLQIGYVMIPDEWKRPPPLGDDEKKIVELQRTVETLRESEPRIELLSISEESEQHVTGRRAEALSAEEIDQHIALLTSKHPKLNEFPTPDDGELADGTKFTFDPPSASAIEEYEERYPKWIAECRNVFSELHDGREEAPLPIRLRFAIENIGTRPAEKLRISFEALGDVLFLRSLDDDEGAPGQQSSGAPSVMTLPKPPIAPTAIRRIVGPTKDQIANPTGPLRLNIEGAGESRNLSGLDSLRFAQSLGLPKSILENSAFKQIAEQAATVRSIVGPLDEFRHLHTSRDHLDDWHVHSRGSSLPDLMPLLPPAPPVHDPEAFYFHKWPKGTPVKEGGLRCDLFRHKGSRQEIEFEVWLKGEGTKKASVRCTVHAGNLTEPAQITVPVSRTVEEFRLNDVAEALIQAL